MGCKKSERVVAIILAGGSGSRMAADVTKQRMCILGKTVLQRSVSAFDGCPAVDEIIIVAREDELDFARSEALGFTKVKKIVKGGKSRAESAKMGFLAVEDCESVILIHDAARCMITSEDIETVANDVIVYGCATASYPVVDTIKRVNSEQCIEATVPRDGLRAVQTPQGCRYALYKEALEACEDISLATDDNMLLESLGLKPYCSKTSRTNIKITTMSDIVYAEFLLSGDCSDEK